MDKKPTLNIVLATGAKVLLEKAVADAERALSERKQELSDYMAVFQRKVLEQLEKGESMGSDLLDNAIRAFGFDVDQLDRLEKFNTLLTTNAGRLLLLIQEFSVRIKCTSMGQGDEYAGRCSYILGRLSGGPLVIDLKDKVQEISLTNPMADESKPEYSIRLPFDRLVESQNDEELVKTTEPKVLPASGFNQVEQLTFMHAIMHHEISSNVLRLSGPTSYSDFFIIGPLSVAEFTEETLYDLNIPHRSIREIVEDAFALLMKPTEGEKALTEGI